MMTREAARLTAILIALVATTTAQAATNWYFEPTVVAAGTASRMARDAKIAINCGFEVVTVRPWMEGDIARPAASISRPMSLIVQASPDADLNRVVGCLERKSGTAGLVRILSRA
jgi:hypothetical protein